MEVVVAPAARLIDHHEQLPPWLIVLLAADDGMPAIARIGAAMPEDLPASMIVLQLGGGNAADVEADAPRDWTAMRVEAPSHGQVVEPGRIYLMGPDLHLTIDGNRRFKDYGGGCIKDERSLADPFLSAAAEAFKSRVIAVVLTGRGEDAIDGIRHVRTFGGIVLVQDPATTKHGQTAAAAIATGQVNAVLALEDIAPLLIAIVRNGSAREALRVPALQW